MYHKLYYYAHKLNVSIYFTVLKIHLFYHHIYFFLFSIYSYNPQCSIIISKHNHLICINFFIHQTAICNCLQHFSIYKLHKCSTVCLPFSTFFNRIPSLSLPLSPHFHFLYLSIVLPHLAQLLVLPFCTINYRREPRTQFVMPSL